eukprot:scaffold62486_cov66-Phaeocystis_antarctica.AAC.2
MFPQVRTCALQQIEAESKELSPGALPDPARGYAGGTLKFTKVLGALIGDRAACSKKLVERVQAQLAPLKKACRLRDTRRCNVALQVQMEINRFCGKHLAGVLP